MSTFTLPLWLSFGIAKAPALTLATALSCAAPTTPPAVSFTFLPSPPQVTHNLDHAGLGQFSSSTSFSHHRNEVFLTGGITESNIQTDYQLSFRQLQNPTTGQACLSVDKVDVTLTYIPVVHMASNFPAGSCRFATTWEHELRHVNTDLITLNEYGGQLKLAAAQAANTIGAIGPVNITALPEQQSAVLAHIGAAVEKTLADIDKIRMQRQQSIDTREEYMRLSKACAHEKLQR